MQRVGFRLRVQPDKLDEYILQHANVWPGLLQDLRSAGVTTYSIFSDGPELFAYLECENWDEFQRRMGQSDANHRWQAFMRDFLATPVDPGGEQPPAPLREIFHLGKQ